MCLGCAGMHRAKRTPWKKIVDWVFDEYGWELDILREYDRTGRLPSRAEVERMLRSRSSRRVERAATT